MHMHHHMPGMQATAQLIIIGVGQLCEHMLPHYIIIIIVQYT